MAYPVASKSLNPNSRHVGELESGLFPIEPLLTPALRDAWILDSTEPELGYQAKLCLEPSPAQSVSVCVS